MNRKLVLSIMPLQKSHFNRPHTQATVRYLSDSITYSGGHASQGQGGFYGSGGSRIATSSPTHHPEATARMADIMELKQLMESISILEGELFSLGPVVSSRTIEIKARIKKMVSNPKVRDLINKLEIKGDLYNGIFFII